MSEIRLCCPNCEGKGTVPLPEGLREVLDLFEKRPRLCAEQVQGFLKFRARITAYNNRLETLRKIGALTRERQGKVYFYSKPQPAE